MKKKLIVVAAVAIVAAGGLYFSRHWLADRWYELNRPTLPSAKNFDQTPTGQAGHSSAPPSPIEGGMASSEHYTLDSNPQDASRPLDPLANFAAIPDETNLAVPWISQAPFANWDMPYQEACEEASMIMLDGFFKKTPKITPQQADEAIQKLVTYQNKVRGDYKDTNAEETAKILRDYFGYKDVRVLSFDTSDDIRNIVGRSFPVIIPFSGKDLDNPNFRNGGPLYHMLVVKGYTQDGLFITNDPGTRKGEEYVYTFQKIVDAAHDWNGGDVKQGEKVMIVVVE